MLSKVTNKLFHPLYVFARKPAAAAAFLPLYQSSVFKTDSLDDVFKESESALRYKQLLPILLGSETSLYPQRFLYTSLAFDPENELLRIVTLRAAGFLTQEFSIGKIIPWSYRDLQAQSKLPEPKYPTFVDDEMVYLNVAAKETLFCESDGQWNAETVKHPKLSIENRLNEKEWFDRQNIF